MLEKFIRPVVHRFPRTSQVFVHQGAVCIIAVLVDRCLFQGKSEAAPAALGGMALLGAGTVVQDLQSPRNNDVTMVMMLAPLTNAVTAIALMIMISCVKGFEYLVVATTPAFLGMATAKLFSDGPDAPNRE